MTTIRLLLALTFLAAAGTDTGNARAAEPGSKPQGTRYVYLIRHGDYDRVDSLDDRTANAMNPLGHEQARLLGERLRGLPVHPRILVSSTLTRARETGDDIGAILGMPCARDSFLEECSPPALRDSAATPEDRADQAACTAQLEIAWKTYMRPSPETDAHDILVCHGNVIRWFVARALGADSRRWLSMTIGNASLTIFAVRPDGSTRLAMYSDVGHIPVEKQTWTGRGPGWGAAP